MFVKEQRVDGSSVIDVSVFMIVRCTLVAGKPVLGRNKIDRLILSIK